MRRTSLQGTALLMIEAQMNAMNAMNVASFLQFLLEQCCLRDRMACSQPKPAYQESAGVQQTTEPKYWQVLCECTMGLMLRLLEGGQHRQGSFIGARTEPMAESLHGHDVHNIYCNSNEPLSMFLVNLKDMDILWNPL